MFDADDGSPGGATRVQRTLWLLDVMRYDDDAVYLHVGMNWSCKKTSKLFFYLQPY